MTTPKLPGLLSPDFRNVALLGLTTVLMLLFFGQLPAGVDFTTLPDMRWYLRIAEAAPNIEPGLRQPFAFRLLGPYLVGLLPVAEPLGFRILTVVSAFSVVFLYYYLLRYVGLSPLVSLLSVMLVSFNRYVFGFTSWGFFMVNDFLVVIAIMTMFLAMWQGRWLVFGTALVLGALTRETAMLMVPVALFYAWEQNNRGQSNRGQSNREQTRVPTGWRTVLLACIPGLVTLLLIRLLIPIGEGKSLTQALGTHGGKLLEPSSLFRLLINTFLPFTFILLVYFRTTLDFFRARKHLLLFVVLVFGTTLFGSNQERLMSPAFIVFFMLLGTILQGVQRERTTFLVLLAAGFLTSFHHGFGTWRLPDANWTRALALGSALVVTLNIIYAKRRAQLPSSLRNSNIGYTDSLDLT